MHECLYNSHKCNYQASNMTRWTDALYQENSLTSLQLKENAKGLLKIPPYSKLALGNRSICQSEFPVHVKLGVMLIAD